jgi:hypothetical protein
MKLFTEAEAAKQLGISPSKLGELRRAGLGPRFEKRSRSFVYYPEDLAEWKANQVRAATAASPLSAEVPATPAPQPVRVAWCEPVSPSTLSPLASALQAKELVESVRFQLEDGFTYPEVDDLDLPLDHEKARAVLMEAAGNLTRAAELLAVSRADVVRDLDALRSKDGAPADVDAEEVEQYVSRRELDAFDEELAEMLRR